MARRSAPCAGQADALRQRARAWARVSAAAQGLPERISDPQALAAVAQLLTASVAQPGTSPGTG